MWVVFLFWLSVFMVLYTYLGYFLVLKLLQVIRNRKVSINLPFTSNDLPRISIIIAAYNEEDRIVDRIDNLLSCNYSNDKVEILVVSDGSTDGTVDLVLSYDDERVNLIEYERNRGRAAVHNDAVSAATGEILIFTDSETRFEPKFLQNMISYFIDRRVGCVVGNLIYRAGKNAIAQAEGFYWKFEKKLRKLESDLKILATGTGACMGVKKNLWIELESTDDVDFISPLDVIIQGYLVVFATEAIAYDFPPHSAKSELQARIRQTSRNFLGTIKRWSWRSWIKHPVITWALISHKILRWLTPYLILTVFLTNLFILHENPIYVLTLGCQVFFCILTVLGYFASERKLVVPVVSSIFAFSVANIGMAIGVFNALRGRIPAVYDRSEK